MKIKSLPPTEAPIDIRYLQKYGIQSYDTDNLYPQNVLNIVGSSKTGSGCLERYKDFMEGDGIASTILSDMRVNRQGETLADIHGLVCDDIATFDGFAIHVNYNEEGRIVDMHNIPFENVRLCEPDEEMVVKTVAIHPDWSGRLTKNGKAVKVDKANIDFIDVFNPNPEIVKAQILREGGINHYKGQVLYVSKAGYLRYPMSVFDAVLTDMSTDEGISNLMLRNARNNFLPCGAFVHYKSQSLQDDEDMVESEDYSEDLRHLQGDTNALAIMDITVETKEEVPEFLPFTGKNIDKDFTATDDAVKEAIYSKFGQEAFLAVRLGKLGFSGTLMQEANDDYARRCIKRQRMVSKAYLAILSHWFEELGTEVTMDSLYVIPLTYAVKTIDKVNE